MTRTGAPCPPYRVYLPGEEDSSSASWYNTLPAFAGLWRNPPELAGATLYLPAEEVGRYKTEPAGQGGFLLGGPVGSDPPARGCWSLNQRHLEINLGSVGGHANDPSGWGVARAPSRIGPRGRPPRIEGEASRNQPKGLEQSRELPEPLEEMHPIGNYLASSIISRITAPSVNLATCISPKINKKSATTS
ncbi:hypothetical protein PCANC_05392 [Puccinia coronata f. sp. avenae]|uniref:Uncharacterized protein n=1 Tax=Puccinia coronata f. sp. avenae TaxID=200324 RepID=A0A2N5VXC3_9BASI|nr:hypothetical protein PCANC_05392 [Puccinia coronata f. sp. avenae]